MGNSPSYNVGEHEQRASALREVIDQGVEHEEEAAYKYRYREYRFVVLCRLLLNYSVSSSLLAPAKQQYYSV